METCYYEPEGHIPFRTALQEKENAYPGPISCFRYLEEGRISSVVDSARERKRTDLEGPSFFLRSFAYDPTKSYDTALCEKKALSS